MKSHGDLWREVTSFENLHAAFRRARAGKRGRPDVAAFEFELETQLFALQRELIDDTYRPGGYRNFHIHEPARRKIGAAPFRDRVVHHALCAVIGPLFERVFLPNSFANRAGKGTHRALEYCATQVGRYRYVLKSDIRSFFPSVDHAMLYRLLARRIRCGPTRLLMRLILDSGAGILADEYELAWFPGDTLFSPIERARGLPIGNLTSQFWANVYLHELDRFVVRELGHEAYLRYVDDFMLFADSKPALHLVQRRIEEFLWQLRLRLNARKTRVSPTTGGVPFLSFVHLPGRRRLKRDAVRRFVRRMRRYRKAVAERAVPLGKVSKSVQSWVAHASYGQTYRLRSKLLPSLTFSCGE